jgi:hypothetical protein
MPVKNHKSQKSEVPEVWHEVCISNYQGGTESYNHGDHQSFMSCVNLSIKFWRSQTEKMEGPCKTWNVWPQREQEE